MVVGLKDVCVFMVNLLFLSWLLTDDGVEHRNVFKSNYQLSPPDLS